MASNMDWVAQALPAVHRDAAQAEAYLTTDPRAAAFYARRSVERIVEFLYATRGLDDPYSTDLAGRINAPAFSTLAGRGIVDKLNFLRKAGNNAVHKDLALDSRAALTILRELFHVLVWTAFHHGPHPEAVPTKAQFDPARAPRQAAMPVEQLDAVIARLKAQDEANARLREESEQQAAAYEAEIAALREQIAAAQAAAAASELTDLHAYDYAEAETRTLYIDLLLHEAGWPLDQDRDREYPVTGLPTQGGTGRVDYVLWGADGLPLAVLEAKRTTRSPHEGQEQARRYADALEAQYGRRPLIFYSNGYEHWLWDDAAFGPAGGYPPREIEGFLTADELERLIQRRTARQDLATVLPKTEIAGRPYQLEAIRAVGEAFTARQRDALLVMATGTGKTRTAIALVDQLLRAKWVKRVLVLADRTALVKQAAENFTRHLPHETVVNLLNDRTAEGRIYAATYPTMLNLLQRDGQDGPRRFGAGHFDLVIIDEAHRSVYQKYGAIFDWFDSLLIGLTATPKDEVDRNTYRLFHLEDGVPTFAFDLAEAVEQGYLVPPEGVSAGTEFLRRGIRYDDLSEEEKAEWDALDWGEDGPPENVDSQEINAFLFNDDTVDKVLELLMERGQKVADGDRLGKTIVFAKNQRHAEFIERRFNERFPELGGGFARVITSKTAYSGALLDDFSDPDKMPQMAISVDMLDTGVDIPDVVNLVLFKVVHSKTKFWQMLGRGTRLRPDLFGPGRDKTSFTVIDVGGNLEYFNQDLPEREASQPKPLTQQIFETRAAVVAALDAQTEPGSEREATADAVRRSHADWLHSYVAAMPGQNLLVRKHRRQVERWSDAAAWGRVSAEDVQELAEHVAGLPSAVRDPDEAAKRFDLLTLRWQLADLDQDLTTAERCRTAIQDIAGAVLSQVRIPAVKQKEDLLSRVAEDLWWEDAGLADVEALREGLRDLVALLPRRTSSPVYTDFVDTLLDSSEVVIVPSRPGMDWERYRRKARAFLQGERDTLALRKLRGNQPLTEADLDELGRMLVEAGGSERPELDWVRDQAGDELGVFIRGLVGLDRSAAEEALAGFLDEGRWNADQIHFTRMLVDDLVRNGVVSPGRLYEDPYLAMGGVDAVYPGEAADAVVAVLADVRRRAEVENGTGAPSKAGSAA
ncbi:MULTISPECIES: DEAD/DEAH box helicase family protein [Micrococcus]|uniref:DEAD/DEAH box helicase family protein n=1 Tax=Micrococcus TaxID=1269 RepID=UPI001EE95742|nr:MULTISPECIES: DEAD/DEAH box helicase family protein [unclassified Micrococcus]